MKNCEARVVGGFQEFVPGKLLYDSDATVLGHKTYWCKKHENGLSIRLGSGRYLFGEELEWFSLAVQSRGGQRTNLPV